MRIISWNVNGLRASVKKGGFDWFINESPDIFCIQEVKAEISQLEPNVANPEGYYSFFDHSKTRKGYSGVAVYSKIRPEKTCFGMGNEVFDQEGRYIALYFNAGDLGNNIGKTVVINCYFPNGGGGPERLDFKLRYYDMFLEHINSLKSDGYEIIFCGDINTAHKEIDLARPKDNEDNTGFLPIERAWIDKVVASGYFDVFRSTHPDEKDRYTYWDMKTFARERNVGWRIDYFFVTPAILERVRKSRILDSILGSDHCPIDMLLE